MPYALIVEDDEAVRHAVCTLVEQAGFTAFPAGNLAGAREIIAHQPLDLALLDLNLPDGNGLELLPDLDDLPRVDVVVVTGEATVDLTVEAFRSGVLDFVTKPVDPGQLREFLDKSHRTARLSGEVQKLRKQLRALGHFGRMVGRSEAMQHVYDMVGKVAPTDSTVFVIGETGTGKELVAETVHELSKRSDKPYLAINCGAIQPNLIESELFGHEKGAFTGAEKQRKGLFERAKGGTVFFDEITEMPIESQVKLLRVLETGEFQRVGGDTTHEADVRLIAATNRDPELAVRDEVLREDLMYRLLVFPIHVPSLRERGGDVALLAEHFLARNNEKNGTRKRLSPDVLKELIGKEWPGNVRELRNAIDRAYIMADDENVEAPRDVSGAKPAPSGSDAIEIRVGESIAETEKRLILATLEAEPNKRAAAKMLGISVKTLYTRLNRYGDQ